MSNRNAGVCRQLLSPSLSLSLSLFFSRCIRGALLCLCSKNYVKAFFCRKWCSELSHTQQQRRVRARAPRMSTPSASAVSVRSTVEDSVSPRSLSQEG
uniref:Putative secreted protein n=1 Tax=Anopheles marajoara TaxID=58244 RepID=A0A2M4C919_9DIPT